MILFFDNNDSFSNNILNKLKKKGFYINIVIINLLNLNFNYYIEKVLLIGPGPSNVKNSNCITLILDKYINKKIIFGICLGHQILMNYFGYKLYRLNIIKHGNYKKIIFFIKKYNLFINKNMIFYNSLSCFNNNKNKEYFFYKKNKNISFQFHPESILSNKNLFI